MNVCSHCDAMLHSDALPEGLCPQCLLKLGLLACNGGAVAVAHSKPARPFGPYSIIRILGEGGMGVVYLAEQQQPIRRLVALKVIKLGMNTREVMARFGSERQALAVMDHPNIARVFDAGVSEQGQPYFAMEFVSGIHITEYCDENRLTNRERAELFLQVCQAVQHAHQKGVIHRDIKPANVLVSERDGKPFPQVIDFGVAKATDQRLAEYSAFTRFGQLVGTPEYMSPEQAELTGFDVDTTTDVYSLGVLLYQLLVGVLPFEVTNLRKVGLLELLRIIREQEPPSPSNRFAALEDAADIAASRRTDPATLRSELSGDLNWIVLKAIEKDKDRRYSSASDLAGDLRRYLTDQPVVARPPSTTYHLQKFARRHKALVASVAAVFAVLLAGVSVSTWEAIRAGRAEAAAVIERDVALAADRANAVATDHVLKNLLAEKGVDGEPLKQPEPGTAISKTEVETFDASSFDAALLKQRLETASARAATLFRDEPLKQAATERIIGEAYEPLALYAEAQRHLERALELGKLPRAVSNPLSKLIFPGDPDIRAHETNTPATLATMTDLGFVYSAQGSAGKADELFRNVLAIQRQLLGPTHPETLQCELDLAEFYFNEGRIAEVESLLREIVAGSQSTQGDGHAFTQNAVLLLVLALQEQGKFEEAEPLLSKAARSGSRPPHWPYLEDRLGRQRLGQHRYLEAEKLLREAVADYTLLHPTSWLRYNTESRLGESLAGEKRFPEAEQALLSGYQGMLQHQEAQVWPLGKQRLKHAGDALVQLYKAWGVPDKATEWQRKVSADIAADSSKAP
jgi:eukaryotic-like serine/threonine-protein kinase